MLFKRDKSKKRDGLILDLSEQIKHWLKASKKMAWCITEAEFNRIPPPPVLTEDERQQGFTGIILCYGFGDDGKGHADAVKSGKLAWDYARKRMKRATWQCEYVDFDRPDDIRLRPEAPARPKGFYYAKIHLGDKFLSNTVSQVRKMLSGDTGCGPEGVQLLAITHPHLLEMMNERKIPFMALADYDVAPYGFNDFFDAPQIFCSNDTMGLGIGNVDRNYPLFGIPVLRLYPGETDS
ncbi:MAG: hypothetical protein JRH18_23640 [Deltaproteobacteria bacterium]|nr:hypothetical protein [Deltaproteobacteria bacterium]MBW1995268.1 hypothetical protein [Deltaproteobacteria bacterium]MBW2154640.1 hypothetical protein [Deltaproteobacteria bacterium]